MFAFGLLVVKLCCVSTRSRCVYSYTLASSLVNVLFGSMMNRKVHHTYIFTTRQPALECLLQKGGVPAAPSGTATLLRLSPSHRFRSRARLAATHFKRPRLPWLDGRCVQGPGTYSPRHG